MVDLTKTPQEVFRGNPISATYQPLPSDAARLGDELKAGIDGTEGRLAAVEPDLADARDRVGVLEAVDAGPRLGAAETTLTAQDTRIGALEGLATTGARQLDPVDAATTGPVTLSGLQTIDGVATPGTVLVKDQAAAAENGIYDTGTGAWTRRADIAAAGAFFAATVSVRGGTVNRATRWFCPSTVTTVGTDPVTWQLVDDLGEVVSGKADTTALDGEVLGRFRAMLWTFLGDSRSLSRAPLVADDAGKVIRYVPVAGGAAMVDEDSVSRVDAFRAGLWQMLGDGDLADPVTLVSVEGHVLATSVSAAPAAVPPAAYVSGGSLRLVGGAGGDRVLNEDAGRTWLSAQVIGGAVQGVWQDGDGHRHVARVAIADGSIWPDGATRIWTADGQSNGEGQANDDRSIVFPGLAYALRPRMPQTAAADIWLGLTTSGGDSVALTSDAITGLIPLRDSIASDDSHATLAVSAASRAQVAAAAVATGGWMPDLLVWSNAEGGQAIANMLDDAGAGSFYAQNIATALTALVGVMAGRPLVYDWMLMDQGENDSGDATLGAKQEQLRAETEAKAQAILGQVEPVRMISCQPSSFYNSSNGARAILDEALADTDGVFFCDGPTYIYPWSDFDYLHHTSIGHAMHGEMQQAAIRSIEQGDGWLPLHMVGATVTDSNEITVTLSEAAVVDEAWLVDPTGLANAGIALLDATVAAVAVSGTALVITTLEPASAATAVRAAMSGHEAAPRSAAKIPRSTIRSAAAYGQFHTGATIHKPLCHQQISIT